MDKNLYIDASHPDETRIVLKSNLSIEEYEYEDKNRLNFKNNIYLGTISRVEPSLQAAFVDFGRVKHGFLAFNDIQSDYYQIPSADKEKLKSAFLISNQSLDEILQRDLQLISCGIYPSSKNYSFKEIEVISPKDIQKLTNKYFAKPFLSITGDKKICNDIKNKWIKNF